MACTFKTWRHRLSGKNLDMKGVVEYAIARAHLDGYFLTRTGSRVHDKTMVRQGLVCSCGGERAGAVRKSPKCECAFGIVFHQVLGTVEDEINLDHKCTDHNHGPVASRYLGGNLELDLPQRLLNQEEADEVGSGLNAGDSVEQASVRMARLVKIRYRELFAEFGDNEAKTLIEVC